MTTRLKIFLLFFAVALSAAHVSLTGDAWVCASRAQALCASEGSRKLTPPLTFGPNRRIGAAGAYIVTINAEKKEFTPVSGWVKAF